MRDATFQEVESVQNYIDSISQTVISIPITKNSTNRDILESIFSDLEMFGIIHDLEKEHGEWLNRIYKENKRSII